MSVYLGEKMKVIIVCHTELSGTDNSVGNILLTSAHHDAKICFVITPEVINKIRKRTVGVMANDHEIGLHIHPNGRSPALRDYGYTEQREMIKFGRDLIEKELGVLPTTFVAGKWSENNDTIRALIDSGFTHDCTPNPGFISKNCDWSKLLRISLPYHPSGDDYQRKGTHPLLMIPVSKIITNASMNPEAAPIIGLGFLKACFEEYYLQQLPLFHIILHSPYMESEYYHNILIQLLEFISKHQDIEYALPSQIEGHDLKIQPRTNILPYIKWINKDIIKYVLKRNSKG